MSSSRSRRMWRLTCASSATLVRPASPVPFGVNLRAIFSVSQPGGVDGSYVLHRKDIAAGQEVRASARSVGAAFGDRHVGAGGWGFGRRAPSGPRSAGLGAESAAAIQRSRVGASCETPERSSPAADHASQVLGAGVHVGHRALAAGFLGEDGVLLEDGPAVVALPAQVPDDRSDIDIPAANGRYMPSRTASV
jgi:hypothetical protein